MYHSNIHDINHTTSYSTCLANIRIKDEEPMWRRENIFVVWILSKYYFLMYRRTITEYNLIQKRRPSLYREAMDSLRAI